MAMLICNSLLLTLSTSFFTFLILVSSTDFQKEPITNTNTRIEMIHRHAHHTFNRTSARPRTLLERVQDLLQRDESRREIIYSKHKLRRQYAIREPMIPGRDHGIGEYLVPLKFGKPAKEMLLIVDTGSDLTWIKCNSRLVNRTVFNSNDSSSFESVPCSSRTCKVDLRNMQSLTNYCPTVRSPCAYNYSYVSGAIVEGTFAKEVITVGLTNGKKMELNHVLIGCTNKYQGDLFNPVDGVLGLGYNKNTFTLKASEEFGGKFSYCLVDHLSHKNLYNYLIFGHNNVHRASHMRYTNLDLDLIPPFYAVNVFGISIGNSMLRIPFGVWNPNSGSATIVDSGTSLTYLTDPAYKLVMHTLKLPLLKFKQVVLPGLPMEFCFNSTGYRESLVPKLVIHFKNGARFEPHVKSYVIDVADGVKCLGFVSVNFPGTNVIGNILQQNFFWEFDLIGKKLGFVSSTCS